MTVWNAQKQPTLDFEPGIGQGIVDELKGISSQLLTDKRNALTQYLAKSEKRNEALSPHATSRRLGDHHDQKHCAASIVLVVSFRFHNFGPRPTKLRPGVLDTGFPVGSGLIMR